MHLKSNSSDILLQWLGEKRWCISELEFDTCIMLKQPSLTVCTISKSRSRYMRKTLAWYAPYISATIRTRLTSFQKKVLSRTSLLETETDPSCGKVSHKYGMRAGGPRLIRRALSKFLCLKLHSSLSDSARIEAELANTSKLFFL